MPDYPFTTDGCSGGMTWAWKLVTGHKPPWDGMCVEHDRAYWKGGSRSARLRADKDLLRKISGLDHPIIAMLMYWAVRVGGHPLLPLPWRWGYGWKYPRLYTS